MTNRPAPNPAPGSGGPCPKPWIAAIHGYVPGQSRGAGGRVLVKLSANENPLGCSPAAQAALAAAPAPARYPDPDSTALRAAIGAAFAMDPAAIVCGTGSGELLHAAVQAFAGMGDEVLFSQYAFSLYPLLAQKVGATPVTAAAGADYAASVDALLAAVTPRTRVVLLDNPNNPVGSYLPAAELARLHAGLPGDVLLVVDQAYAEYVDPDDDDGGLALATRHANVLVTRTLSKIHGLAGERVGWATGAPPLVDLLNRLRGAFNVSTPGQAAAAAAIGDPAWVERCRTANAAARERLTAGLAALANHGIRALPSEANFVLVLFEGALTAAAAMAAIAEAGYAVRHLPGQGLPHALRITVGLPEEMDAVIAAIACAAEAEAEAAA